MPELIALAERLVDQIREYGPCVVALSGGVDSAVVAKAALLAHGDQSLAVTSVSPSLAQGEREAARAMAQLIGIAHEEIATEEMANPLYVANGPDRCYHCKSELYAQLSRLPSRFPNAIILNGTNLDDLGDYRPGLQAATEHRVRSPLAECQCTKDDVRALAAHWELPVWNKPAMPCLSSRIAYGEEVTPQRLRMVDAAEAFLRSQGFSDVRVRYHRGDLARLEVPLEDVERLAQAPLRALIETELQRHGFRFVTLDLAGFRSGSLNQLVPAEQLQRVQANQLPQGSDRENPSSRGQA